MKRAKHYAPTRTATIVAHTLQMLHRTGLPRCKFAMQVVEKYCETVEPHARKVPFKWGITGDDLVKAEKLNDQQLGRYMDGTIPMPVDLEDAWVCCLPEPFRAECERDLARRRGMLPFWIVMGAGAASSTVGAMAIEFGELVQALAPTLADGKFTREDVAHARKILDEADGLIASVLSVRSQIEDLLGQGSGRAGDKSTSQD